jgi:hypothetical protein
MTSLTHLPEDDACGVNINRERVKKCALNTVKARLSTVYNAGFKHITYLQSMRYDQENYYPPPEGILGQYGLAGKHRFIQLKPFSNLIPRPAWPGKALIEQKLPRRESGELLHVPDSRLQSRQRRPSRFGSRQRDVRMVGPVLGNKPAGPGCRNHEFLKPDQPGREPHPGKENAGAVEKSRRLKLDCKRGKQDPTQGRHHARILLCACLAQKLQRNVPPGRS